MPERLAAISEERIREFENSLLPDTAFGEKTKKTPLLERMEHLRVPGVSIAVINDCRLEWAKGYGVLDHDRGTPTTTSSLFQAASISKPVAAAAALRLVSEGALNLDEDVNAYLRSWRVPANGEWQPRLTLRLLLSHTAATTVHGFPGYRRGRPVPALDEVLDGLPPSNTAPVRVDAIPGMSFRYSGGGTTIVQQLLVDVLGKPFPGIMNDLVLEPLGMGDSTYEQPLPERLWPRAAAGHRGQYEKVAGDWHVYPEMAAAGLWTIPSDLARYAISILEARAGARHPFLSPSVLRDLLTPQNGGDYGLGFLLEGAGNAFRFGHTGSNEGMRCAMVAYADQGCGAVVMTNGDNGSLLCAEVVKALGAVYGWPAGQQVGRVARRPFTLDEAVLEGYSGEYELRAGYVITVKRCGGSLSIEVPGQGPILFYPVSRSEFASDSLETKVAFIREAGCEEAVLRIAQVGKTETACRKIPPLQAPNTHTAQVIQRTWHRDL